jgi:hypothetical protein
MGRIRYGPTIAHKRIDPHGVSPFVSLLHEARSFLPDDGVHILLTAKVGDLQFTTTGSLTSGRELWLSNGTRAAIDALAPKQEATEVTFALSTAPLQLVPGHQDRAIQNVLRAANAGNPRDLLTEQDRAEIAIEWLFDQAKVTGVDLASLITKGKTK